MGGGDEGVIASGTGCNRRLIFFRGPLVQYYSTRRPQCHPTRNPGASLLISAACHATRVFFFLIISLGY
jgi:hypothetical protein